MSKEKILKIVKSTFWYLTIFLFTTQAQIIVIAMLFPNGGGEYHILYQLAFFQQEQSEISSFLMQVYRAYLFVGICAAFILSLCKPVPAPMAIAWIAGMMPVLKWSSLTSFILANIERPYLFLFLGFLIQIFVIGASYVGVKARKLIFLKKEDGPKTWR